MKMKEEDQILEKKTCFYEDEERKLRFWRKKEKENEKH